MKNPARLLVLIVALFSITLISCNKIPEEKKVEGDLKEIYEIKTSDVDEYLSSITKKTLENIEGVQLKEIKVKEDSLRLQRDSYKKTVANMVGDIYLEIDSSKEKEASLEEFREKLMDSMETINTHRSLSRIGKINIIEEGDLSSDPIVFTGSDEEIKNLLAKQDEDLNKLDKSIFDIASKNLNVDFNKVEGGDPLKDDYSIIRLGLEDGQLVVETRIFGFLKEGDLTEEEKIQAYKSSLEDINTRVLADIKKEEVMKTLEKNKIKTLTMVYTSIWEDLGTQTYSLDI